MAMRRGELLPAQGVHALAADDERKLARRAALPRELVVELGAFGAAGRVRQNQFVDGQGYIAHPRKLTRSLAVVNASADLADRGLPALGVGIVALHEVGAPTLHRIDHRDALGQIAAGDVDVGAARAARGPATVDHDVLELRGL